MSPVASQAGPSGRAGELALWSTAGLLMLSVHIGAAALLMREVPDMPADNAPPAAIMIELAPEPEAINTEEDQIAPDLQDQKEVKSEQAEPVEPPKEIAEPVAEEPPSEMPEPQITQTIPEPSPEPVEKIDPIEEQMTAALENVEVPLPVMRPLPSAAEKPPEDAKKPEPEREQIRKAQKPKRQQEQARQDMAEAKVQARQSDRTAASQNAAGLFSQSISPAKWKSRVQAKLARNARKCPGNGTGTAAVRFSFDGSGNVTSVSLSRSSGDSAIDNYIISAVRRASPIPAPPSGVASYLDQALTCL